MERLRAAVQALTIPHAGSEAGVVTISVGVASVRPEPGQAPTGLSEDADRALHRARNAGRNKVEG